MGILDWGLGIGDWGLGIGPNPQSPIPNPQSPIPKIFIFIKIFHKFKLKYLVSKKIIKKIKYILKFNINYCGV